MEISALPPTAKGPAERFTGDVWVTPIPVGATPSRAQAGLVRFAPGAHTFWHRHTMGQTLHILSGVALVGTRDGRIFQADPGQTVSCPAGEDHWHGAAPDFFMEHLALSDTGDGSVPAVQWLEEVSDEQYNGARTRA